MLMLLLSVAVRGGEFEIERFVTFSFLLLLSVSSVVHSDMGFPQLYSAFWLSLPNHQQDLDRSTGLQQRLAVVTAPLVRLTKKFPPSLIDRTIHRVE